MAVELYYYREALEFGPNQPSMYANQDVLIVLPGTNTPAPIFSDHRMLNIIPNSIVRTDEFGELAFFSARPELDFVRRVGGRRTTHQGDPGGVDEQLFTRAMFFS